MVLLVIKRGDELQFLVESTLDVPIERISMDIVSIFNCRLKVQRLCWEIEELAKHGPMWKPEIIGLAPEQVTEMQLVDEWLEVCVPSDGYTEHKDPAGRRVGRQPNRELQQVLLKAIADAKKMIAAGQLLVQKDVQAAIDLLRGAVTIVYPMQLPPHDVIRMEFSNTEDLTGTHASREVIEPSKAQLWFAGHHMLPGKTLADYLGKNEKCKVILKLAKCEEGQPSREPVVSEEERKQLMLYQYRKQEEYKKLKQDDDDDQYLNSAWADSGRLKRQVHGLDNVNFRYGNK